MNRWPERLSHSGFVLIVHIVVTLSGAWVYGTQPGSAAACFTHFASCASSSWSSS
jgi:hypothetical protein